MDDKKTYLVGATPILIDGQRAEPGDTVELTESVAAGLGEHVSLAEAAPVKKGSKA